jgi:hypothetical protein
LILLNLKNSYHFLIVKVQKKDIKKPAK